MASGFDIPETGMPMGIVITIRKPLKAPHQVDVSLNGIVIKQFPLSTFLAQFCNTMMMQVGLISIFSLFTAAGRKSVVENAFKSALNITLADLQKSLGTSILEG